MSSVARHEKGDRFSRSSSRTLSSWHCQEVLGAMSSCCFWQPFIDYQEPGCHTQPAALPVCSHLLLQHTRTAHHVQAVNLSFLLMISAPHLPHRRSSGASGRCWTTWVSHRLRCAAESSVTCSASTCQAAAVDKSAAQVQVFWKWVGPHLGLHPCEQQAPGQISRPAAVAGKALWAIVCSLAHPGCSRHLLHVHGLSTSRTSLHRKLKPIKSAEVCVPANLGSGYLVH